MTDYKQLLDELVKWANDRDVSCTSIIGKAIALAEEMHVELVSLKNKHADEVARLLNQVEQLQEERDAAVQNYASAIRRSEDENAIHRIVRTENERLKAEVEEWKENYAADTIRMGEELNQLRTAADKMKEALLRASDMISAFEPVLPTAKLVQAGVWMRSDIRQNISTYEQARGEHD